MSIPILTYHAVEINGKERATLPPNKALYLIKQDIFEAQMRYLADSNFCLLLVDDLISVAEGRASLAERALCLTFDDGNASDYRVVFRILRKFQLKATFFVITDRVGAPGYVTWDQLKQMSVNGMSIQSHSHTHPFLSECSNSELRQELVQSKALIEKHLGKSVEIFAVPGGDWNKRYRSIVEECGCLAVCTSNSGINQPPFDLYALKRLSIRRADPFDKFVSFVNLDSSALFINNVKTNLLSLARRSMGLNQYNLLRAWLLQHWMNF